MVAAYKHLTTKSKHCCANACVNVREYFRFAAGGVGAQGCGHFVFFSMSRSHCRLANNSFSAWPMYLGASDLRSSLSGSHYFAAITTARAGVDSNVPLYQRRHTWRVCSGHVNPELSRYKYTPLSYFLELLKLSISGSSSNVVAVPTWPLVPHYTVCSLSICISDAAVLQAARVCWLLLP